MFLTLSPALAGDKGEGLISKVVCFTLWSNVPMGCNSYY
jgi:hypothetical protein